MATAVVASFRWLDVLENEFDKAFVELDTLIPELDSDETEMIDTAKNRLTTLSSSFAQLVHKAQTIFQNNAKLEAQVVDFRDRIINCTCQDQNNPSTSVETSASPSSQAELKLVKKCKELEYENEVLKQSLLSLQGEVYGARLASKYLDKELAGRIQQLQLLCKQNMNSAMQKKLWDQIESEIFLHRHKTVARACRGQYYSEDTSENVRSSRSSDITDKQNVTQHRLVKLHVSKGTPLGISVTGGSEHGLPILISAVHPNSVAALSGEIFAGDSILSINNISLKESAHSKAVQILTEQSGNIILELAYTQSDDEDLNTADLQYGILSEDVGYKPTYVPLNLLAKGQDDDASTRSLNGSIDSSANLQIESSAQTGDTKGSDSKNVVIHVGEYSMSNVQSYGDTDDAVFNSDV